MGSQDPVQCCKWGHYILVQLYHYMLKTKGGPARPIIQITHLLYCKSLHTNLKQSTTYTKFCEKCVRNTKILNSIDECAACTPLFIPQGVRVNISVS